MEDWAKRLERGTTTRPNMRHIFTKIANTEKKDCAHITFVICTGNIQLKKIKELTKETLTGAFVASHVVIIEEKHGYIGRGLQVPHVEHKTFASPTATSSTSIFAVIRVT
jgi:hypothetical protein